MDRIGFINGIVSIWLDVWHKGHAHESYDSTNGFIGEPVEQIRVGFGRHWSSA
jgi:hypothetical protein